MVRVGRMASTPPNGISGNTISFIFPCPILGVIITPVGLFFISFVLLIF